MPSLEDILDRMRDLPTFLGIELTGPNDPGHFGDFPLHVAAHWGDLDAIAVLLAHGAELDARDEHGYTPLLEAVESGQIAAVGLLIKLGGRADIPNDIGMTALEMAEIDGNDQLLELLQQGRRG